MMREIRLALLEADVFTSGQRFHKTRQRTGSRSRSIRKLITSPTNCKIVDEELTKTLGSETVELNKSPKIPTVIMMTGLQGAGKTTFTGKLAKHLMKTENARPLLIAVTFIVQPIDQLKVLGQQKFPFLIWEQMLIQWKLFVKG